MIEAGIDFDTRAIAAEFGRLADNVKKRVARKAVNFALTPALKEARQRVQKRSGFTARSIRKKAKAYEDGSVGVAMIGVDRKARLSGTTASGKPKAHVPSNIDHLLHEGFIHSRSGRFIEGSRFISDALVAKQAEVKRRLLTKLEREVVKEAEKAKQ